MTKTRLEAFSDSVFAILIGCLILHLRLPEEPSLAGLQALLPALLVYALSFVTIAVHWNNHQRLFQDGTEVTGAAGWANIHLLFWLSLLPFSGTWAGRSPNEPLAAVLLGTNLICAGAAYALLRQAANAGRVVKSKLIVSLMLYASAIALAYVNPLGSYAMYLVVALMWAVPEPKPQTDVDKE